MFNYSIQKLIDRDSIRFLFNIFNKQKKEIKLVGGCVRDALLLRKSKDIDVAARLKPDEIIDILTLILLNFSSG